MSTIARHYDETKNLNGGSLPGVPLGDITDEQFEAYPEWLKQSIDAHPMYRKTKPTAKANDPEPSKPKPEKE